MKKIVYGTAFFVCLSGSWTMAASALPGADAKTDLSKTCLVKVVHQDAYLQGKAAGLSELEAQDRAIFQLAFDQEKYDMAKSAGVDSSTAAKFATDILYQDNSQGCLDYRANLSAQNTFENVKTESTAVEASATVSAANSSSPYTADQASKILSQSCSACHSSGDIQLPLDDAEAMKTALISGGSRTAADMLAANAMPPKRKLSKDVRKKLLNFLNSKN